MPVRGSAAAPSARATLTTLRRQPAMSKGTHYIAIKVKPNCRAAVLRQQDDGSWYAELTAPPVDGKANAELLRLVARHFGCPSSAVSLKSGAAGRSKLVKIAAS